jgi:WD40 repeat protein
MKRCRKVVRWLVVLGCVASWPARAGADEKPADPKPLRAVVEVKPSEDGGSRWAHVSEVAFSPDGKLLAAGVAEVSDKERLAINPRLRVWDTASGQVKHDLRVRGAPVVLAFSADGRMLAWAGRRGDVEVVDVATGRVVLTGSHGAAVDRLAFGPDGKSLVSFQKVEWRANEIAPKANSMKLWRIAP